MSSATEARGAAYLDRRVIPDDFDWHEYDNEPEISKVLPGGSFVDAAMDAMEGKDEEAVGALWPWQKMNDKDMRFRPGEVTLYCGPNGHRKSTLTTQIAVALMRQQQPVLIESFEMRPQATIMRMLRQSAGAALPTRDYAGRWREWSYDRLWLYNHYGDCPPRQTLAVARYGATLGVKHVLIDSLLKVVADTDDYNGQKKFVGALCKLAQANSVHVHLVAHSRKGKDSYEQLDKYDVRGAGEITDQVDTLVLLNKADPDAAKADKDGKPKPDQWLRVEKQRNGRFEGSVGLWFDEVSQSCAGEHGRRWVGVPNPQPADER